MEVLLEKIGELVATELDEVEDVRYLDPEMGYTFVIFLKDGTQAILSLIETELK